MSLPPRIKKALTALDFWNKEPSKRVMRLMRENMDGGMTEKQFRAFNDRKPVTIILGGNQSGKTRTAMAICTACALGKHPRIKQVGDVNIWLCTTSYDKFAEQAWGHLKNMMLWPHEDTQHLPTYRIDGIDWVKRNPETPRYFAVKRPGGLAHFYVHTFAQGRKEFQGQSVDLAVIDEECPDDIYEEINARFLAKPRNIVVAATPIDNVAWLESLCSRADQGDPDIAKHRLPTWENPSRNDQTIEDMRRQYKDLPEQLALRLEGIALSNSGLVYPDRLFTDAHIIKSQYVQNITNPHRWSLYRCIDAGFRFPACVWMAVSSDEKQVILYRSWRGRDMTIKDAAREIKRLSGEEQYVRDLIDPEVLARSPETGRPEIEVWQANGITAVPAWETRVRAGLEKVWQLMSERVELATESGSITVPRFRVSDACTHWLEERRRYKHRDVPEERHRNIKSFEVVKRDDHTMDPTRILVATGLHYVPLPPPAPPPGHPGYEFVRQRRGEEAKW